VVVQQGTYDRAVAALIFSFLAASHLHNFCTAHSSNDNDCQTRQPAMATELLLLTMVALLPPMVAALVLVSTVYCCFVRAPLSVLLCCFALSSLHSQTFQHFLQQQVESTMVDCHFALGQRRLRLQQW
jgi:hypothetical protein